MLTAQQRQLELQEQPIALEKPLAQLEKESTKGRGSVTETRVEY
jgi:hypothetical protein